MKTEIQQHLLGLQQTMQANQLWEATPPSAEALASTQPFCLDTLSATQWLQWIFIPRMQALLAANADLPRNFAVTPYLEEALKNETYLPELCKPLHQLEQLLKI